MLLPDSQCQSTEGLRKKHRTPLSPCLSDTALATSSKQLVINRAGEVQYLEVSLLEREEGRGRQRMDQNGTGRKGMDNQHSMNKINKILASLQLLAEPGSQTIDIPKQNKMKQNKRRDMAQ